MSNIKVHDQFMFYSTDDSLTNVQVIVEDESIWASQKDMGEIFGVSVKTVNEHLGNIFETEELKELSVIRKFRITASDGKNYLVNHYNLDTIISVGYRVNSYKATQFRIWATNVLKEFLKKGFVLDDDRLKQGKNLFGKDYFDELLERIREIRASERRFYQKVTDIYQQCSYDYDTNSPITKNFFAHSQDKLEYAITHMTSAEIKKHRANHNLPNMGLLSWSNQKKGGKITKKDVIVAKNYLTEDELKDLNRLVNMFLDYAENLASKHIKMPMKDWHDKLDSFLKFNEYEVLQNYGKIKADVANKFAKLEYDKYRPIQDAEYKSDFDKVVEEIKSKDN